MKTVLSTKILSPSQKQLLLNAGLGFVEYNAIKIIPIDFEITHSVDNFIFTSKNAVKAFLKKKTGEVHPSFEKTGPKIPNIFCVGENTRALLEENGLKVVKNAENASKLGEMIAKKHKNESFLFFCGNRKRKELPTILTKNGITFKEIEVYNTELNPKKFDRSFNGVLFFSPSAVESYTEVNQLNNIAAFCIGNTTAEEAKIHTNNIIIANKPTIENTLVQVVKFLNPHK